MAGETPDYGALNAQSSTYPVLDLGELAARLGSPIAHDRRGDVIWWEDFEWGLAKVIVAADGTGSAADLSTAAARNGRMSLLLTGGSDSGRLALVQASRPYFSAGMLGVEIHAAFPGAIDAFELRAVAFNGTQVLAGTLRFDDTGNSVEYLNAAGSHTSIATGFDLTRESTMFHAFKLVIDPETATYERAIINGTEYDLSGIALNVNANFNSRHFQPAAYLFSTAGLNELAYVDDLILSMNEPPN